MGIDLEDRIVINGTSSRFVTKHKLSKITAKTTPEHAQEIVWLKVMNDQTTAARRIVHEYVAAKGPIVPLLAYEVPSAFDGASAKAGPVVDAIVGAIEHELEQKTSRVWRSAPMTEAGALNAFKNDFFDKLLWTLIEMGRVKARQLRDSTFHPAIGARTVRYSMRARHWSLRISSAVAKRASSPAEMIRIPYVPKVKQ